MYENFFNPKILEVLFWMMEHRGEYSANLIYEQTSLNQYTLVQYLHLLYTHCENSFVLNILSFVFINANLNP